MMGLLATHIVDCDDPPERVEAMLSSSIDGPLGWAGENSVRGWVRSGMGVISRRIMGRNSFKTSLYLTIAATPTGSRVTALVGIPLSGLLFGVIWLGMVFASISAWPPSAAPAGTAMLLLMTAMGVLVFAFCRLLARDHEAFLIDFVATNINGRVLAPPIASSQN
jgi:hypothetical protein